MAYDSAADSARDALKLRGTARQVASFVAALFLVGALLAAGLDLLDADRWDAAALQSWTLVSQSLAGAGLFLLAWWRRSISFLVLATLITLVVIEEAFHVLNPVSAWLAELAQIDNTWTSVRLGVLNGVLIYGFVAVIGVMLLTLSHWRGSPAERRVVRNVALMLFTAGFFGGPISTVANWGDDIRQWMFIEECGEALVFVAMIGYVAGLVALSRRRAAGLPAAPSSISRRPARGPTHRRTYP